MANSQNPDQNIPANRPRLAEKMKSMKNGIKLRYYTEHTEDKGADTEIIEAEQGGEIVGKFVKKDGVTIESQGSEDAQASGDFDAMAKKVGSSDAIIHTKAETVSEVAHDNQPKPIKDNTKAEATDKVGQSPSSVMKFDNNTESEKADFVNNSKPKDPDKMDKSSIHYHTGEHSVSYEHGGAPKPPKIQKTTDCVDAKPLKKKWQVFMESTKGFTDPLQKLSKDDPKKFKDPVKQQLEQKISEERSGLTTKQREFWDVLGRKKKTQDTRSTEEKIKSALEAQAEKGNPFAVNRERFDDDSLEQRHTSMTNKNKIKAPVSEKPVSSTGIPNIRLASVTETPKPSKKKQAPKVPALKLVKSFQQLIKSLQKGDVIHFQNTKTKSPDVEDFSLVEPMSVKMQRLSDAAKKFADRHTAQQTKVEIQPHPKEVIDVDPKIIQNMKLRLAEKTEKSSLKQTNAHPTNKASATPTIKNVAETVVATNPVPPSEGLSKDKKPQIQQNITPQHLPSAENGLESHLQALTDSLQRNQKTLMAAQDKSQYGKEVPKADREKNMKLAERTHKYLQSGIALTKMAIEARDSKNPNWSGLVGTGNPKVNQMGILTFGNTLPGHNCPARGGCGDGSCYGMNGQQAMGNALELRARNSGLIQRPDFVQGAIQALKNAPKHLNVTTSPDMYEEIKNHPRFKQILLSEPVHTDKGVKFKVKAGDVVRWLDTGDILNEKHLNDIAEIAKAFPEKKFYLYTKSLHLPLDKLRSLPNFNVIQSFGGKHNDKIDMSKPHAKYFSSLDEAHEAGYTPVWYHDYDAASGVNNLALVPHGARKGEIDPSAYNVGVKDKKIKKSTPVASSEPDWFTYDQPDSVAQSAAMGHRGKMLAMVMLIHKHDLNKSMGQSHPESFTTSVLTKGDLIDIKTKNPVRATQKRKQNQPVPSGSVQLAGIEGGKTISEKAKSKAMEIMNAQREKSLKEWSAMPPHPKMDNNPKTLFMKMSAYTNNLLRDPNYGYTQMHNIQTPENDVIARSAGYTNSELAFHASEMVYNEYDKASQKHQEKTGKQPHQFDEQDAATVQKDFVSNMANSLTDMSLEPRMKLYRNASHHKFDTWDRNKENNDN